MTLEKLKKAVSDYLGRKTDRADVSALDVMIARARTESADTGPWISLVEELLHLPEVTTPGFWSAIRLIVGKLEVRSKTLAGALERTLVRSSDQIDSFDCYEGWRTFADAGGFLTVKQVDSLTGLRNERAPLWLDLALIAHQGDPAGLGKKLSKLVSEGLVGFQAIKPRFSQLQSAFGQDRFLGEMKSLTSRFPSTQEAADFGAWMDDRIGTILFHDLLRNPLPIHTFDFAIDIEAAFKEAAAFVFFENPVPQPILQAAA